MGPYRRTTQTEQHGLCVVSDPAGEQKGHVMGVARGRLLEQSPKVVGVGVEFPCKIRQVGLGAPSQLPDPFLGRRFAGKITESLGEPRFLLIRQPTTKVHFEPAEVLPVLTPAVAVQDANRVTKTR